MRFVRRTRFSRKKRDTTSELNLTSLTDMFAFILTFLLKTLSISAVDVKPMPGIQLPSSISSEKPHRYVAIDVHSSGIYLEKSLAQPLYRFELNTKDHQGDVLPALQQRLKDKIAQGGLESSIAIIRADQNAPFDLIWKVMVTARQLGFEEFQNLTIQKSGQI